MTIDIKWLALCGAVALVSPIGAAAQERRPAPQVFHEASSGSAALEAEILGLKADRVAWRQIAWKSCLLDGLRQARETHKPAILWIFIDRPADDARC
jgi:hypothetical protein